jgi:hypothetical protein
VEFLHLTDFLAVIPYSLWVSPEIACSWEMTENVRSADGIVEIVNNKEYYFMTYGVWNIA